MSLLPLTSLSTYHRRQLERTTADNAVFFGVQPGMYWAKVLSCYDGDSMTVVFKYRGKIEQWRVRLYGVDTCEMKVSRAWSKARRARAKQRAIDVRDHVRGLISNRIIQLEPIKFGKYGRLVAKIHCGDAYAMNLGDHLISTGRAVPYFGKTKAVQKDVGTTARGLSPTSASSFCAQISLSAAFGDGDDDDDDDDDSGVDRSRKRQRVE
jgi:endonuclease YncB( thermonuclease family)